MKAIVLGLILGATIINPPGKETATFNGNKTIQGSITANKVILTDGGVVEFPNGSTQAVAADSFWRDGGTGKFVTGASTDSNAPAKMVTVYTGNAIDGIKIQATDAGTGIAQYLIGNGGTESSSATFSMMQYGPNHATYPNKAVILNRTAAAIELGTSNVARLTLEAGGDALFTGTAKASQLMVGSSGAIFKKVLTFSEVIDLASVGAGSNRSSIVSVTGATAGGVCTFASTAAFTYNLQTMCYTAADNVFLVFINNTASPIDLPSLTYTGIVFNKT